MSNASGNLTINPSSSQAPTLFGTVTALTSNGNYKVNFANGTTADKVDLWYAAHLTFVASTPQALDLTALADPFGGTVAFARIRRIYISINTATDGQGLTLGYSTTTANAWTSFLSNPGTIFLPARSAANPSVHVFTAPNTTGWTVGSTNKLLNLNPGSAAFTADIDILGCSA